MSDTAQQTAAAANRAVYDSGWTEVFVEGAPHLKHADLRAAGFECEVVHCFRSQSRVF